MCLPVATLTDEDTAFAKDKATSVRNAAAEMRMELFITKQSLDKLKVKIASKQTKLRNKLVAACSTPSPVTEEDIVVLVGRVENLISGAEKKVNDAERMMEEAEELAVRAESVASSIDFLISQHTSRPFIEKYLESVGWR